MTAAAKRLPAGDEIAAQQTRKLVAPLLRNLEPSENIGARPTFAWIPKEWVLVSEEYQRSTDTDRSRALIRRIVEEFDWSKFSPVTVAELHDGPCAGYWIAIDGQHRCLAALAHPLVTEIPAWIVAADRVSEQAKAFVSINRDRTAITTVQLFRAQLAAGDPDAAQVAKVCAAAGVSIAYHTSKGDVPPRHTVAVAAVRRMIVQHGEGPVTKALSILADAYPDKPSQMQGSIIMALVSVLARHHDKLDRDRMVRVLGERDCAAFVDAARDVRKLLGISTPEAVATAIVRHYDKGLSAERRLSPSEKAA